MSTQTFIIAPVTPADIGKFLQVTDVSSDGQTVNTQWLFPSTDKTIKIQSQSLDVVSVSAGVVSIDLKVIPELNHSSYTTFSQIDIDKYGRVSFIDGGKPADAPSTESSTKPNPGQTTYPAVGDMMVAGYLDCTSTASLTGLTMSDANKNGYSKTVIIGFGWVGPYITNPLGEYAEENATAVYIPGYAKVQGAARTSFAADVLSKATEASALVTRVGDANPTPLFPFRFLSFGGSAQTFNAKGFNMTDDTDLKNVASKMFALAKEYHCNGIDLDLEMDVTAGTYLPVNTVSDAGNFIKKLCVYIKEASGAAGSDAFYITIAPQINKINSRYRFVSAGTCTIFDQALMTPGCIDYAFIQYYNTGWSSSDGDVNPWYPVTTYANLSQSNIGSDGSTSSSFTEYPANVKFVVGWPSTVGAGVGWWVNGMDPQTVKDPSADTPMTDSFNKQNPFWYGTDSAYLFTPSTTKALLTRRDPGSIYATLKELSTKVNSVAKYPRFAGVFCWSMNRDSYSFKSNWPWNKVPAVDTHPDTWYAEPQNVDWDRGAWGVNMSQVFSDIAEGV